VNVTRKVHCWICLSPTLQRTHSTGSGQGEMEPTAQVFSDRYSSHCW
jgi:hypothetical protein